MSKKKIPLLIAFFGVVIFSFWSVCQLGRSGGPCNGGLITLELLPFVLIISILQLFVLLQSFQSYAWTTCSFICSALVAFISFAFADEHNGILYLAPFLIINIVITFISTKNKKKVVAL
ncbi:MAG TPA: hypothetical protein VK559_01820 [Ferruginibacter sp.]|nr:hypothetical protein [Ferruginibacter sp.]